MPKTFTLSAPAPDGTAIPVAVTRKRVRNLNLRIRADGTVVLSIPLHVSAQVAQDFLQRRGPWIFERRQRLRSQTEAATADAASDTVPLWGRLLPLSDALGTAEGPHDDLKVQARVEALYAREVARALPEVAARLEQAMGVRARSWSIRHMRSRWGSCTPARGTIRINAALAAYPPRCLEYVVAHELTHLMEPSHNRRFHTLLGIWCPHARTTAALLKQSARTIAAQNEQTARAGDRR